jgi:CBS domain-containing protein
MADTEKPDLWSKPIKELPLQEPMVVREETTIQVCINMMQEQRTGCAIVVDENEAMTGVFTERDVMVEYIGTPLSSETAIKEVMTADAYSIPPEMTVSEAIDFFGEHKIRHLPVCTPEKKLIGLLSIRVLTDYIAEHLPEDVLNLPPTEGAIAPQAEGA